MMHGIHRYPPMERVIYGIPLAEALAHGGIANNVRVKLKWIDSEIFEKEDEDREQHLSDADGILVPGGFGQRGTEGMIWATRFARERKIPFFGICFGMQMAVVEEARHLVGLGHANSSEFGTNDQAVIGLLTEWTKGNQLEVRKANGDLGGTMRLGAYACNLKKGSKVREIYGIDQIAERHRHRYEVNTTFRERLEKAGVVFSGMSPDGALPEIIERADHPWFIGVQFHPELRSKPLDPHPLFRSFIAAAVHQERLV